ncbi:MAG: hypothetical protein HC933_01355 [Pleurocapsa sp. SU_196_0]|nr:hypothetical protein [Pleurocapsa sp. SU_196_0]
MVLRDGEAALCAEALEEKERSWIMPELFHTLDGQIVTESGLVMQFSSDRVWVMDRHAHTWAVFNRNGELLGCSTPITLAMLSHLEAAALKSFEGIRCHA